MNPSPDVTAFLAPYSPAVRDLALRLRALVLEVAPGALEQVDAPAKMLAYGWAPTYKAMIAVIMPLKDGVNLGIPRGATLPDPDGLLTGSGKRARHIRITTSADIERPGVRALLEASAAAAR